MVLVVLASHAGPDGTNARPGNPTICKKANLSKRSVQYAIESLLLSRELVMEAPNKGTIPASYRINLPMPQSKAKGANGAPLAQSLQNGALGVQTVHPKKTLGVQMTTARGANDDTLGVQMTTARGANDDIAYKEEPYEPSLEPIEPKRESSEQEALETSLSPLSLALCEICILDPDILSPIRYSDLIATEKKLSAKRRSPDDVREFGKRWFVNDWRGKKGDAPSLTLVTDEWERVMSGPITSGETWEQEKARRIREEKQREGVAANGRNGWKF